MCVFIIYIFFAHITFQVSSINRVLRNLAAQKEQHQQPTSQPSGNTSMHHHHQQHHHAQQSPSDRTSASPTLIGSDMVYDKFRLLNGHHHHSNSSHLSSPHHAGTNSNSGTSTSLWPRAPTAWYPSPLNGGGGIPFSLQPLSPSDGPTTILPSGGCTILGDDLHSSKKGELTCICSFGYSSPNGDDH